MSTVEGWATKRFDEIGIIFSGSTPSTTCSTFWNGEIVWVTPNDLSKLNTPNLSDTAKRITEKGLAGCSAHLLPAGSIVMSSRAPIGYVAIPLVEFCTNQGCKSIQLKENFNSEFTYYNILFNIDKVKNLGEGTTFAEISKTALSTVTLEFPQSKPEQTKIAEILSTVDRAIEQTEALIAKQQRIKTGLMQDLLTRGIDEHGNLRSEETHKFKDSPLGRIPVEWEVNLLIEVLTDITYGLTVRPKYVTEGIPLVSSKECRDGWIDYVACNKITERDFSLLRKRSIPKPGDILVTKTGTLGRVAQIKASDPTRAITQNVALLKPDNNIVHSDYLELVLTSEKIQKDIRDGVTVLSIPDLQLGVLGKFHIPLPSLGEQDVISRSAAKLLNACSNEQHSLSKLRSLKTALMQDLLTGKKRVTALLSATEGSAS